jgi:hypothetical protein
MTASAQLRPGFPVASNDFAFTQGGGNVLQLSRRRIDTLVAYCQHYEFEDVAGELTQADRVEPQNISSLETSRKAYRLFRMISRSRKFARRFALSVPQIRLDRRYELFLPVFNNPYELFSLATIPDWRERCTKAACFISEYWIHQYRPHYLLELLRQFDHVFIASHHAVDHLAKEIGRPVSYLPLATNVLRFSPLPLPPTRSIDVCNIGRRSSVTHQVLLRMARERRIHYHYDTIAPSGANLAQRSFHVDDPPGHRQLLGNIVKRSRYFIANRARVNEPEYLQHLDEISGRFYEGVAGGAVMLGEAPRTDTFRKLFDWPNAVIPLPFDSPDVEQLLAALDAEPKRMEQARRHNLHFGALRHDWVHRLRVIYETLDVPVTAAMMEREVKLRAMAQQVLEAPAGTI